MLGAGPLNWLFFRAGSLLEQLPFDEPGWRLGVGRKGRFRPVGRNHDVEPGRMKNRNLVYVVDDDTSMLKSVDRLLRQLGYASLLFPSAKAFATHDDFDKAACILLDIDLGDASGIDLGHRLKAANVSVPIIYMTGNDHPAVREAAHRSGCLAYLTKPFSAASLATWLQRARHGS